MNTALQNASILAPRSLNWKTIAQAACTKVPPLWPLDSFVAVNPFLGLSDKSFVGAADLMQKVTHGSMLPAPSLYQGKLHAGEIADTDLEAAIKLAKVQADSAWADQLTGLTPTHLKLWLHTASGEAASATIHSVADAAERVTGGRWGKFVEDEVSKWCAAYHDEKQSSWRMPWSALPLFSAWREAAMRDAQPELLGLRGFRSFVKSLPANASEALAVMMDQLGIDPESAENYLHRALMSISGWAGFVQFRVRENGMAGITDDSLLQLLVVRVAYDAALLTALDGPELREFWISASAETIEPVTKNLACHYVWQLAAECGYQRSLIAEVGAGVNAAAVEDEVAKAVQAVFCIDVRSEVFRRSLESVTPEIETLGFAGFFAMPMEFLPLGHQGGSARCPVLLTPKYKIRERLANVNPAEESEQLETLLLGRRIQHAWNAFKNSAISCFSFVETAGLGFAVSLFKSAFAKKGARPSHSTSPDVTGCGCGHDHVHAHASEDNAFEEVTGIPAADQVALAHGALRHMGLTQDFGRIVLLCGHGSETVNNPYGAGLDCGACGGHAGDANARVAATLLNQPHVRKALAEAGVEIPASTWFMAGLHNTTTDEVTLFEVENVPDTHQSDVAELQMWLSDAAKLTRAKRAPTLGLGRVAAGSIDDLVSERSADWSQVRPEWGLAGNAAFIAAPRERTKHMDLGGRSFLHNYTHSRDEGCATLELILTAPVIVASWINLQYYASTVNNAQFGSGNKVTHNVVGTLGVCQGNGGDLKTGLPLQSVHDGQKWMHEPLRLSVFIEAPREAISMILEKHQNVRELFDNGWLHLFAIEDEGKTTHRYLPGLNWELAAA